MNFVLINLFGYFLVNKIINNGKGINTNISIKVYINF